MFDKDKAKDLSEEIEGYPGVSKLLPTSINPLPSTRISIVFGLLYMFALINFFLKK